VNLHPRSFYILGFVHQCISLSCFYNPICAQRAFYRVILVVEVNDHGKANKAGGSVYEMAMNTTGLPFTEKLTDVKWQAILENDAAFDGQFYYAVKTTGIFCRPSCKSRPPHRENIGLFQTAEQAQSANYRPCKRCRPTGQRLPDEEWIALVTEYIDKNYREHLTLDILAAVSHGSPYHLHRIFKKVTGMTTVDYIQQTRIGQAKKQLSATDKTVHEIAHEAGFTNLPYFITLFKRKTGLTPAGYRQRMNETAKETSENGKQN